MTPRNLATRAPTLETGDRPSAPFSALLPSGTFVNAATVMSVLCISESKLYDDVRCQRLPPPVRLGKRMSRFVSHEVAMMATSIVGGASVDERRALVKEMVAARVQKG